MVTPRTSNRPLARNPKSSLVLVLGWTSAASKVWPKEAAQRTRQSMTRFMCNPSWSQWYVHRIYVTGGARLQNSPAAQRKILAFFGDDLLDREDLQKIGRKIRSVPRTMPGDRIQLIARGSPTYVVYYQRGRIRVQVGSTCLRISASSSRLRKGIFW